VDPLLLAPNQLHRFYRGGARIAELRGTGVTDDYAPEEWVGSTTAVFGSDTIGITLLPDGTPLPEAISRRPEDFLGPEHVRRFGNDPRVLVKLLDAGERLPVHLHPDRAFARAHLGSEFGKTEAWVIVAADPGAAVHLGFGRDLDRETLRGWVEEQATRSMLGALHEIPVEAGDVVYVPAGIPHAIGEGILMVELQEPSDLSILLEWEGFAIDGPVEGHLGLGLDRALDAVDLSARGLRPPKAATSPARSDGRPGVEVLFAPEADAFFRAERVRPAPSDLPAAYSLLVVIAGQGTLEHARGEMALRRGDAVLVPFSAGDCRLRGDLELLRCMPPDPAG
jgi:mannose-6-phosphate isomerase